MDEERRSPANLGFEPDLSLVFPHNHAVRQRQPRSRANLSRGEERLEYVAHKHLRELSQGSHAASEETDPGGAWLCAWANAAGRDVQFPRRTGDSTRSSRFHRNCWTQTTTLRYWSTVLLAVLHRYISASAVRREIERIVADTRGYIIEVQGKPTMVACLITFDLFPVGQFSGFAEWLAAVEARGESHAADSVPTSTKHS